MAKTKLLFTLICFVVLDLSSSIDIPIADNKPTCMIITSSFDPIKVELKFPLIPQKVVGEAFKVSLMNYETAEVQGEQTVEEKVLLRKDYPLLSNILYYLCIQMVTNRDLSGKDPIYVGYTATEDFQSLIGKVEIPEGLGKDENLKQIYENARKMASMNAIISSHQQKQRELEDALVTQNIHKSERIITLTVVECAVILLSGLYQVFALRKFLIEKNLY